MIPRVLRLHNPMSALVWLALFAPGQLFGGRLGLLLPAAAVLIGGAALFSQPSPWETRRTALRAARLFFVLALLDVVSYAYSTAFNGIRTGPLDLWALSRPLVAGLFVVYLIRHYDASVRRSLESALTAAVYLTLFLVSIGAGSWSLFEPVQAMGYVAVLAAVYFLFFSRAPLRRAHAAAAALVVYLSSPAGFGSARGASSYFWRSPILGWGPARYEPMAGNQYLTWLLRNGALGMSVILIGAGLVAYHVLRAQRDRSRRIGAALFLGAAALMLAAGAFLEDFRLFALTSFLIAGMREEAAA